MRDVKSDLDSLRGEFGAVDTSGLSTSLSGVQTGAGELSGALGDAKQKNDDLGRSLADSRNGLQRLGDKLIDTGLRVKEFGLQVSLITSPLREAFGAGIRVASTYEDSMAEIGARSGATADQMAILNARALELGAVMPGVTSQDVLEGFLELTTGGMAFDEALVALQPTMTGAVAGGQALADQANDLTDVMNILGWSAQDAGLMVDFMAKAAGATSATMPELWDAVAAVGPVANQFGVDFYETAEVMSVFADAGIRGSEAGTQLRSMLLNMNRPTDDVKAAWEELGTSFYDANGNARGLEYVIEDLKTSLAGFSVQDQNELIKQLAGSYGAVALTTLLAADPLSVVGGYIDESAGAADVAAAKMNTYSGSVETLQGSLETLATTVLTPFMDNVLKPLNEEFTKVVTAVTDWAEKNPEVTNTLVPILGLVAIAGPGLFIFGIALQALGTILAAGGALIGGLSALGSGLLGAAVGFIAPLLPLGLLLLSLYALKQLFDTQFVQDGIEGWKGAFEKLEIILDTLQEKVNRLIHDFQELLDKANRPIPRSSFVGSNAGWISPGSGASQPSPGDVLANPFGVFGGGNALGGAARAGVGYLIGERGPEMFFPGETGYVAPIRMGAGGGGDGNAITINLHANGINDPGRLVDMIDTELRRRTRGQPVLR